MLRACLIVLTFAGSAAAQQTEKPGEWVDLLAGGLDTHWTTKGNWSLAADGAAVLTPRKGEKGWSRFHMYLWSKAKYTEFECEFEYRLERGGNSGFYFRVGDQANPVNNGIEVQIYDAPGSATAKLTDHASGGVIPGVPPTKHAAKPAGEWNRMLVSVRGDKLTVTLNGEQVNEVDLSKEPLSSRPREGWIGFQDHALPLSLRNVRIREFK